MDTKTIKLFAKYNEAVNIKMDGLIIKLADSQWNKQFGGYFPSIKSLCNHIYISDFNWLKRFSKLRKFDYINSPGFNEDMQFGATAAETVHSYLDKRVELDRHINDFANEITAQDFTSVLEYTDSHGINRRKEFGGIILHMFNHQTHHRGMISIYLEEMKIDNNYSNFIDIL